MSNTVAEIIEPDTTAIERQTGDIVSRAEAISVETNEELVSAGDFLVQIKTVRKAIADTFDGPIKAANQAHKAMLAAKRKHDSPLANAETVIKRKVGAYQAEQERIRREREERLRAEALEAEEERRIAEAAALEAEGHTEEAEQAIAEPVAAPVVVVPKSVPKVEGVSTRTTWKWRIGNIDNIPREYLKVDEIKIGQIVRAMKDQTCIPGIEVYPESSVAVRAAG